MTKPGESALCRAFKHLRYGGLIQLMRLLMILPILLIAGAAEAGGLIPADLRCEYRTNPLGIDSARPRLFWLLKSLEQGSRNQRQTAYQIIVATSKKALDAGKGDLWDSGKRSSGQSAQIEYGGRQLGSRQQCHWKVRVWDENGEPSAWSAPSHWSMGLLDGADWKAHWAGAGCSSPRDGLTPEQSERVSLREAPWIWHPGPDARQDAPKGRVYLRKGFDAPAGLERALLAIVADDAYLVTINGQAVGETSVRSDRNWQHYQVIDVTRTIRSGRNLLAIRAENTGGSAGAAARLFLFGAGAEPEVISTDGTWRSSAEAIRAWNLPQFDDSGWGVAAVIGRVGDAPWGFPAEGNAVTMQPFLLRRSFELPARVRQATVYASAMGLYELYINGRRVGKDLFTPGWTDYRKRFAYQTYDVTGYLKPGENAIGAVVAPGWYGLRGRYGRQYALLAQMEIETADGRRLTIATDGKWRSARGPFVMSDIYDGEEFDRRLEIPGWSEAGLDDSGWAAASIVPAPAAVLSAHPGVPVRRTEGIRARSLNEPSPGVFIFDMGQNFTGWARLYVDGPGGTRVTLRFGEQLNPDGTLYTANLRSARCTDVYTLRGGGPEIWEPHFTFHGFQYVEVTGYPGRPGLESIRGIAVNSDTPEAGFFECSEPLLNKFWRNTTWTQRGNFLDIPTDCPQRDERLGWTGDAQVFAGAAAYNMDVAAFFTKWLTDLEDGQFENGALPDVAPTLMDGGTAAWGDAGTIVPWAMYRFYGDRRILEQHYDAMKRWVEYLRQNSKDLIRSDHGYGDWLAVGAHTPRDLIGTAYFAYSTRLTGQTARVLGLAGEARQYDELYEQVKKSFIEEYVEPGGVVKGETQTGYLLALALDLVPEEDRQAAAGRLVADIRQHGHLTTGFVGTPHLLPVLSSVGETDLAYELLMRREYPSWLYPVTMGATSIWERWDGIRPDGTFNDPGMNSFAHYAYGCAAEWLFSNVAGIIAAEPGFQRLIIRPEVGGGLTWAKARYRSIHGEIGSSWRLEGTRLRLTVTIPPNSSAVVLVPGEGGGRREVGSGVHVFESVIDDRRGHPAE